MRRTCPPATASRSRYAYRSRGNELRPAGHRRRHQWRRHRPRCCRPRALGAAGRARRSGGGDLVGVLEADPWRAALSRAVRVPPGRRGARRARDPAAHCRAPGLAGALRHAASAGAAAALGDPAGAVFVRSPGPALAAAGIARGTARRAAVLLRSEEPAQVRLRLLRLPRGRRAPGGCERRGCCRARRAHLGRHRMPLGAARWRAMARVALRRSRSPGARDRQRGRPMGQGRAEPAPRPTQPRRSPARQGQPYRAAAALRRRARLYPAKRRPASGVHDPLGRALHAGGNHRYPRRRAGPCGNDAGRGRLSVPRGEPLSREAGRAARGALALRRRAAALRRWIERSFRRHARLHPAPGCGGRRGAGAVGVRRQNHHLPQARRARAGEACAVFSAPARRLDRADCASGERLQGPRRGAKGAPRPASRSAAGSSARRFPASRRARHPGAGRREARRAFWRRPDRARAALFHRARMGTRRAGRALAAHEGRAAPRSTRARARRGRVQPMKPLAELDARGVKALLFDIDDTLTTEGKLTAQAYDALERLRRAGKITVPVTGRPAGWCDHIARMWPVDAVVGENGAFYFFYAGGRLQRRFQDDAATRPEKRARLDAIAQRVLAAVPGCALAADQSYRETDLAIDYCEDVPPLPLEAAERIASLMREAGLNAKISSIHVNGWFGDYDKLAMSRVLFTERFGMDLAESRREIVFAGDSPNDAPLFAFFSHSVGVANVRRFKDLLADKPKYVTRAAAGAGFSELAEHLLQERR